MDKEHFTVVNVKTHYTSMEEIKVDLEKAIQRILELEEALGYYQFEARTTMGNIEV